MKQTDAIDKYFEAKKSGYSDEQAKLFARSWAESRELHPEAVTKTDLEVSNAILLSKLESKFASINSRFVILTTLGAFIFTVCAIPFIQHNLRMLP